MDGEDSIGGLIKAVAEGNEHAFRELYETTQRKVFHYLYRFTNDRHMAEDLVVDTYVEVWKSARKFRGESRVLTWIIGISRNIAMNAFRQNRVKESELDENMMSPPEQFQNCAGNEVNQILKDALNSMPVIHREILDLVFLQGMHYEEIARIVQIPVNTVKTRVFHAKEKLRSVLKYMGVTKNDLI
jgi:RNA polymerase sigma-70 factor (ECF subfamily)